MALTKVSNSMQDSALVSVLDFGATGDGTTDDSAAIQAAISSLVSGGGIYIPSGTYMLLDKIDITTNNITIQLSNAATLSVKSGSSQTRIFNIDADNISIIGGKLTTNESALALNASAIIASGSRIRVDSVFIDDVWNGVNFYDASTSCWVTNCRIQNCGQDGIITTSSCVNIYYDNNSIYNFERSGMTADGGTGLNCSFVYMTNNYVDGNNRGNSRGIDVEDAEDIFVSGNTFLNMVNDGMFIGNAASRVRLVNNYVNNSGENGILLKSDDSIADGNTIIDAGKNGIWLEQADNISALNNTVTNSEDEYGILINRCTGNCRIVGNSCDLNYFSGIANIATPNTVITSNICMNNGQGASADDWKIAGIALDDGVSNSDNLTVTGNRCGDTQGTATQEYGVVETGVNVDFVVVGNNLIGNNTAGFQGSSGSGVVGNNAS